MPRGVTSLVKGEKSVILEYVPGNSLLHKVDPRVKIIALVVLTFIIFLVRKLVLSLGLFAVVLTFWLLAGISLREIAGYMKLLLGLFIFLIVVQGLFQPGQTILLKPLIPSFIPLIGGLGKITLEGVLLGILISFRVLTLVCLIPLVVMTTELSKLALGLVKLGLPYRIAYIATTALNMVPTLQNEISAIIDAQRLRAFTGFESGSILQKIKAYPPLVVPLVVGAMRRSQLMATAMDARAFGCRPVRTYIEDISFHPVRDTLAIVGLGLIAGLFLYLNFTKF